MAKLRTTITVDELTEPEQVLWRAWLRQYLSFDSHIGRHSYRMVVDPLNPKHRVFGCWKCGKAKPE